MADKFLQFAVDFAFCTEDSKLNQQAEKVGEITKSKQAVG